MDKIKVLNIDAHSKQQIFGGVESFFLQYAKHMDLDNVKIDYAFCGKNLMCGTENDVCFKNSEFFELNILGDNNSINSYIRYYNTLSELIKKNKYDIIHINTAFFAINIFSLLAGMTNGCKTRISHSHSREPAKRKDVNNSNQRFRNIIRKLLIPAFRKIICILATDYFACSKEAGSYLFGSRAIRSKKFRIITNAIDTEKFSYNNAYSRSVREEEGIKESTIVIGHVGRMTYVKNHDYIIEVFKIIHEKEENTVLWLVGDGELRTSIADKIHLLGLDDSVKLFGQRYDSDRLMQGMDCFIFPSFFEGLGIAAIEAQSLGLPVYASDGVPSEACLTELFHSISLESGPEFWADYILNNVKNTIRMDMHTKIKDAGYDIGQAGRELEKFYLSRKKRSKRTDSE